MKNNLIITFATLSVILLSGCAASRERRNNLIEREAIVRDIQYYIRGIVSTASYSQKYSEVYNAMYIVATKEYPEITKESEKRGYIEAKLEKESYIETMTLELRGDNPPFKVAILVKEQRRTKNQNGTFSNWNTVESATGSAYLLKVQREIYEQLNGPIKLSNDLQTRVNNYNDRQKDNRTKIL